jgi:hypothetical protein
MNAFPILKKLLSRSSSYQIDNLRNKITSICEVLSAGFEHKICREVVQKERKPKKKKKEFTKLYWVSKTSNPQWNQWNSKIKTTYADRVRESGAEAGGKLLRRRHLKESGPSPLPSYLEQHLSLSLSAWCKVSLSVLVTLLKWMSFVAKRGCTLPRYCTFPFYFLDTNMREMVGHYSFYRNFLTTYFHNFLFYFLKTIINSPNNILIIKS